MSSNRSGWGVPISLAMPTVYTDLLLLSMIL